MSKHSTFKIGGNADFFVMPSSIEEVQSIFKISGECDVPVTVLGNGSNILVSDNSNYSLRHYMPRHQFELMS